MSGRRRSLLLGALGVVASARLATAQCPDGTPPPCAGDRRAAAAPARNSIAVLYFDNLSRDSADTYIADGLTDEVIVRLQHVQRLDVKSRYEVRRLRGTRIADARSVGRELRVAWLVTGSVRPSPSRMRVSYELVRTSDGRTMVSDIVDTTATDQWAISNGVALAIARQVAGRLAPDERAGLTRSPSRDAQAVDLYRRGTYLLDRGIRGNRFDIVMSLSFFRAALERDSSLADAWASMAYAWTWVGDNYAPNRLAAEAGRVAARRALTLDSASTAASAALGYALNTVDYDWAGAERVLRRAIALDPRGVESRLQLSRVLSVTGRTDEAVQAIEEAWAIDSLNPRFGFYLVTALTCGRRYADLLRWSQHVAGWGLSFWGYWGIRQLDSTLAYADRGWRRAMALAAAGRMADARSASSEFAAAQDSARTQGLAWYVDWDAEAIGWAAAGDPDRAFAALERSYGVRSGNILPLLGCWPAFDGLRVDPRYHDLLRRMHLEP